MAEKEKKKFSLGGIDDKAEGKGSFFKTLWQIVKFLVVSGLVTIIQLASSACLRPNSHIASGIFKRYLYPHNVHHRL